MAQLRQKFGLDQPVHVQLLVYLRQVLTLDLGYSFRHGAPVSELILTRLGPTLLLMMSVFVHCGDIRRCSGCDRCAQLEPLERRLDFDARGARLCDSGVLGRSDVHRYFFDPARMVSDQRIRRGCRIQGRMGARHRRGSPPGPAGDHVDAVLPCAVHAADARFGARPVHDGLCGHCACERSFGATDRTATRASQRRVAGSDDGGRASRCTAGRRCRGRDRFRVARTWDFSPTNRCLPGTSTCCLGSSSFLPAWS